MIHDLPALRDQAPVYCANLRAGFRFAVAEAYAQWRDISEDEVAALLAPRPLGVRPPGS